MPSDLYRWLAATAEAHADRPAITFVVGGERTAAAYTFGELFAAAESIGSRIIDAGLAPGAPVGLLLSSQEDQVLHYLGALHAGAVPAVLTPPNRKLERTYYLTTMRTVLGRCDFAAVISDVDGIEAPCRLLAPHRLEEVAGATGPRPVGTTIDAPFLQFSSGTTGIKRGVVVSDDAVRAQLEHYAAAIDLRAEDRVVSWLPLYHDMGFIACLNMPLAFGAPAVMLEPIHWVSAPVSYLRAVSDHGGTLSWHPNFAFAFMAERVSDRELEGIDLATLRGLVNCSEPVTEDSQRAFLERFGPLGVRPEVFRGCYAMAETTFALTDGTPDEPGYLDPTGPADGTRAPGTGRYVSVGRPLPGVDLRVVDPEDWRPMPERRIGELWARSPFTFTRYHAEPEATAASFVDGWYRTGDLGYRVGDQYYVTGRRKDLLIVGGVNVFPQDIEDVASATAGVRPGRASAFSRFDPRLQSERVVVLAEPLDGDAVDDPALAVTIRQRILAAFQIGNFEVRLVPPGWLVKSSSGKMARSANRDKWLGSIAAAR